MEEKYLPMGSVVRLKGATKRIMIVGYLAVRHEQPDIVYTYSGISYPEGFMSNDQIILFNHDQIEEISFKGFVSEEQQVYERHILKVAKEMEDQ